jgi:DNA-binding transcriptional LysR family regulator
LSLGIALLIPCKPFHVDTIDRSSRAAERLRKGAAIMHKQAMFDWNDLKYLLAVAREGSTLAAAKVLRVNQSTVQRRLARLEQQLGVPLVERRATGYRLSDEGAKLLPRVEHVEAAVNGIERHIAVAGHAAQGSIKLTCSSSVAQRLMKSRLLDSFCARFPTIQVELILTERVLDLSKGDADIAIRGGRPSDPQLVSRKIADVPWAIYASRSYVKNNGKPKQPDDFKKHSTIEFVGEIAHLPAARWLRSKASGSRVAGRASNLASVQLAVRSGAGIAALPVPLADMEDNLVQITKPIPDLALPMYLVTHQDLMSVPRIGTFFAHCLEELRPVLRGDF